MSIESPEPKKEISEPEWQDLKNEAVHWRGIIVERLNKGISRSYSHIFGNLAFGMGPLIETADIPTERKDKYYKNTLEDVGYIKRYEKLLEDFPDFAEKELNPGEGYFPETYHQLAGTTEFIDAYEEKLRGGEKEDIR